MSEIETILVTGGAGYIGSHTNKQLHKKAYNTVVVDNLVYGHRQFVKWGDFVLGDLSDLHQLRLLFQKYPIFAVMHFAGYTYVGESYENPEKYYINNYLNTLNLLRVMREFGVPRIIFSSTCATYGEPETIPLEENHPQEPINPYGMCKLFIEKTLADYHRAYGLEYVSLRYFNAAGADPDGEIGEKHEPETHLIPIVLDVALDKRPHLNIFGTDYDTPDGTCIRDYIHVNDLAEAHILALEYLLNGGTSDSFNLGSGAGYSVKEVVDAVQKTTGKTIKTMTVARRKGDPARLISSSQKAKEILKWQVKYKLEDIIETAWNWHKKL